MDLAQVFIIDLGWMFFAAWSTVLAAVAVAAFGGDVARLYDGRKRKLKIEPRAARSIGNIRNSK